LRNLKTLALDELEGVFRRLDTVLEGFWYIAEAMGRPVGLVVVSDAGKRRRPRWSGCRGLGLPGRVEDRQSDRGPGSLHSV